MSLAAPSLTARIAALRLEKPYERFAAAYLGRRFPSRSEARLLIYHEPTRICYAQVYPFFHYSEGLRDRFGLSVRARPVSEFMSGRIDMEADMVMIQPWFDVDQSALPTAVERFRARHPSTRLIFLDSYAHNDLRLGGLLAPHVDLYLKKSLFVDRTEFIKSRAGDTNLAEYYGLLYDTHRDPVAPDAPAAFLDRLDLSPGFLTSPFLLKSILTTTPPDQSDRPIDVHARIEQKGSPWYSAMRREAELAVRRIEGVALTPEGRIPLDQFLGEMRRSKLCWSPFGYGELCWRDIEAFLTGAVLIKPDMSHLVNRPDLFRAGETYLPCKWDFSDLEEVVRGALADRDLRERIARQAFAVCRDYLASTAFVDEMGPLMVRS